VGESSTLLSPSERKPSREGVLATGGLSRVVSEKGGVRPEKKFVSNPEKGDIGTL